jgi:ATP-dependent DNA helicase RecG
MPDLDRPIDFLKGVGEAKGELLKRELGVRTCSDLLFHFPFRYIDRSRIYSVSEISADTPYIQLKGVVSGLKLIGQKYKKRLVATLSDDTGSIELVWFKGAQWMAKYLQPNATYVVFGKPTDYRSKLNIAHPEMELAEEFQKKGSIGLHPVYSTTEKLKTKGLDAKGIGKLQRTLTGQLSPADLPENLPASLLSKNDLMDRYTAFKTIHFPKDEEDVLHATKRLKYEELFYIQMATLSARQERIVKENGILLKEVGQYLNGYYKEHLPFELTEAQKRVVKEIRSDVVSGTQMNRLVQGDVGSGKTVVALLAMLMAIDNGYQAAMMVPTEILARQHFQNLYKAVNGLGLQVGLLTGSVKGKERTDQLRRLAAGDINILIGTHALIEDQVKFSNLGMVVIDEQHRFGVAQRARLWTKGAAPPHVLVMTATPIPRTLAMTLYGDLDVSVIDELPPGRKPIITVHRMEQSRLRVFGFLKEELDKGNQVFVVYPLIEGSESMDYNDLMDGYEAINRDFPSPDYRVGILHGQMKPEDKDFEMARFLKKETNIMVATSVIEVGVDVPNVSVMVIESSERFGLSQLHQLRGRVGRGDAQAYCILMSGNKLSNDARKRIKTMVQTNNGFEIAEVDLSIRGPGELEGTQQSGIVNLRLADLGKDGKLLAQARNEAMDILDNDPDLSHPDHYPIKSYLEERKKRHTDWSKIS